MAAPRDTERTFLLAAFAAVWVGWGSTYLAIRIALETLPPFALGAIRFLVAGSLLYVFVRLRGVSRPDRLHWRTAFLTGFLFFFVGNGAVIWVEQTVPSGIAALVVGTAPLFIAAFEALKPGGKWPTPLSVVGLLVGFVGVVLLVLPDGAIPTIAWGDAALLLLASASWAAASLYSRSAPRHTSASLSVAMQMLAGGSALFIASVVHGEIPRVLTTMPSARSLGGLAYLIVIGSLVSFSAYMYLFRHTTAEKASTYAYVNPIVAVAMGCWIGGEKLSARILVAGLVIVSSVVLLLWGKRGPRPLAPAKAAR